jgi:ribosome biogenesis protein Nip4
MIVFRILTDGEVKLIQSALDGLFGENITKKLIQYKKLIVAEGKWTEIFLVSTELLEIFKKIHDKKQPYFLGLFLGELRNKRFKLSLEAVFEIANFTSHKIQLTMKGAQKLLYGRDITFSDIDINKIWYDARKGDYAILLDENGFPIGLGKILHDFAKMQKKPSNKICIKNIIDRGWYLRKGK